MPAPDAFGLLVLVAIVKDELHNESGGIVSYLQSVLPFVDAAVVVDTGSSDGTFEALTTLAMHIRRDRRKAARGQRLLRLGGGVPRLEELRANTSASGKAAIATNQAH